MSEMDAAAKFVGDSLKRGARDGPNQPPKEFVAYLLTIKNDKPLICENCLRWIYRCAGEERWKDLDELLKLAFESIGTDATLDEQSLTALFGYTGVMKKNLPNRELLRPWHNMKMKAFYGDKWNPSPNDM